MMKEQLNIVLLFLVFGSNYGQHKVTFIVHDFSEVKQESYGNIIVDLKLDPVRVNPCYDGSKVDHISKAHDHKEGDITIGNTGKSLAQDGIGSPDNP